MKSKSSFFLAAYQCVTSVKFSYSNEVEMGGGGVGGKGYS